MERHVRYYIIGACVLLIIAVCSVMLGMAFKQGSLIRQQTYEHAGALFDSVVLMRRWNAEHGGVFVLKKPGELSNPYLDSPDIIDTKGRVYTKKNPALMTKEISAYAEKAGNFTFHITSLKLMNPQNAPDAWEKEALSSFALGEKEAVEVVEVGRHRYFRLMRPLYFEESCLECHQEQGYHIGDVRGGISVTLPYDARYAAIRANFLGMAGTAAALVLVFVAVLYFFVWRLTERLSRQKMQLAELNETKDRFLGMAAHDLRNPLVVISGYSDLLHGSIRDGDQHELLDGIIKSTDRMLYIVNSLLDVSKIEAGKLDLLLSTVNVAEFLEECTSVNEVVGRKKDIKLKLTVPMDIGSAVFDRERMRQVLDNLLSNAFKYSHRGTAVVIGAEKAGDRLRIWVQDEGVGIRKDEQGLIFDEFAKVSTRPTGGEVSHGLGLAISRRMVELHGGSIGVKSELGEGSRFTIDIPVSPRQP